MNEGYVDIESVGTEAETIGTVVSPEYSARPLTPPARYLSESRKITAKKKPDGSFTFQIDFQGGLMDRTTGRRFYRPDRAWVGTKTFKKRDFANSTADNPVYFPGETSQVGEYLIACGFPSREVKAAAGAVLISMVAESQHRPVMVRTGLEPKGNSAEGYVTPKLYTKHFKNPDSPADAPTYRRQIEHDGRTWEARERVEGFQKFSA